MRALRALRTWTIVVVLTLLLAEVVLRATMWMPWTSSTFVADSQIGFRVRPGAAVGTDKTNASGFNDVDHAPDKPAGITRLAIIGDSFVFGVVPRAANFVTVVQRAADAAGADLEVSNMGIPGAGPKNYLAMIRTDAAANHVDLVGVVVFLGNDIMQAHPDFETRIWLGDVREVLAKPYAIGSSWDYFSVLRLARATARVVRERLNPSGDGTFSRRSFVEVEAQRSVVFETHASTYVREAYASLIDLVAQMRTSAYAHGMKLFVVLAPDQIQTDPQLQQDVIGMLGTTRDQYAFDKRANDLQRDLEGIGVPTLNLLPVFERDDPTSLYVNQDTHWNDAGNALAGRAIWGFLHRMARME